jgi:ABC-type nitrate/sulfonate/bicarbonate transport system ATPase subunit
MIELADIVKAFQGSKVLVEVSLRVAGGEIVCITGPSGCGKTTLLEIVAGTLKPDRGSRAVSTERVGYVFQDDCLVPWLTVEENLRLGLSGWPETSVCEGLEIMGLAEQRMKKPAELSGGMKRRLNVARALAIKPELLLLDEPFAFQDQATIELLQGKVLAANRENGVTVILVSHDAQNAAPLGGRLVPLSSISGISRSAS